MSADNGVSNGSNGKDNYAKLFQTQRVELIATSPQPATTIQYTLNFADSAPENAKNVFVFVSEQNVEKEDKTLFAADVNMAMVKDFKGEKGASCVHYTQSGNRIIYVGLGKEADLTLHAYRSVVHAAVQQMKKMKLTEAVWQLPVRANSSLSAVELVDVFTRISTLSNHVFTKYITKKESHFVEKLSLVLPKELEAQQAELAETQRVAQTITECTVLTRELASDRADVVDPQYMEDVARQIAQTHADNLKFNVLHEEELLKKGYQLIAGVGQGAKHKARIVTIEYTGNKDSNATDLALVGKGITFDTGGLNLKPTNAIELMYLDMSGSAAVLGAIKALAILKPNINVVAALALAENAIDANAQKPHIILPSVAGTVMIANTDAEGRLALADTFTHVQTTYQPRELIDMATLTGACVIALGEYTAGLWSNNDKMAAAMHSSGQKVHERVWRMPIAEEVYDELKYKYADLKSTGMGKGGACAAAAFLQKFIDAGDKINKASTPTAWSHVDIAGPAMYSASREWIPEGGTGFGVQLLVEYVTKHAANKK